MKNTINYYYNLNPNKINQYHQFYYFYVQHELYYFKVFTRDLSSVDAIYQFNLNMLSQDICVDEIICNRNHSIITYINQVPYILTKISINIHKPIYLSEISYLSNLSITYPKQLMRANWISLWCEKIDYLEYHHEQNYQKFPILSSCFDYFIGLAENAISYLYQTIHQYVPDTIDIGVISHHQLSIYDTIDALYEPQNIIIDHKARDLSEYIKLSFFKDNFNIFDELDEYFHHNYFSIYGIQLVLSRILYPSFYFNCYEDIVNLKEKESTILKITSRIDDYEYYLKEIWKYFHKYYPIQDIEWINAINS